MTPPIKMNMPHSGMRTYEIPYFPDLSLPKYLSLLGEQALPVAASRLVGWVKLLASSGEAFSFTLRYRFDPRPKEQPKNRRLRLNVIIQKGDAGIELERELGESMVRSVLRLDSVDPSEVALTEDHLRNLALLGRGENFAEEAGTVHYRPEKWVRSSRSRQALEPFLDEVFDTLTEPAFLDVRLRAVDARPLHAALRAAMADLEAIKDKSYYAETLREAYKAFLEELQPSPVCEIVIYAGAASAETAQRLIQVFAIETTGGTGFEILRVQKPETRNKLVAAESEGDFFQPFLTANDWFSSDLEEICSSKGGRHIERYKTLSQLRVVVGPDLVEDFLTLPIPRQGFLRTFPIETELHAQSSATHVAMASLPRVIVLGQDLERNAPAQFETKQLNKHAFIAGVTGSGKTVTMFNILRQLAEQRIPTFVFEPAKAEYRGLARLNKYFYDNLRVYTPGRERLNPLRLNPFEFYKGITLGEHVANLMSAFQGALPLWEPLPSILEEAIWGLYEEMGWEESDEGTEAKQFPRMSDILTSIDRVMDKLAYDPENDSKFRGAFRSRFIRLTRGNIGKFFDAPRTTPAPREMFTHPAVLELNALSQEQINLATMFMLVMLREYLKGDDRHEELKLVIVLEEAHNLVPAAEGKAAGEGEVNLRAEAARYVTNMLAEMRALGLSIIVVDQTPSAVSPYVVKNTNLKLAHRTVAKDDRETLAQGMLMNPSQEELLGRLRPGEAFLYSEQFYRPILIANSFVQGQPLQADDDAAFAPNDRNFQAWLDQQEWYVKTLDSRIGELSRRLTAKLTEASGWDKVVEEDLRLLSGIRADDPQLDETRTALANDHSEPIEKISGILSKSLSELSTIEVIRKRLDLASRQRDDKAATRKRSKDWEVRLAQVRARLNQLSEILSQLKLKYDEHFG